MEAASKNGTADDFVTVVSVGSQAEAPKAPPTAENFVTVLAIGNDVRSTVDGPYVEEEVEVFRLPGERLGFGLKFEGGNKTSEKIRRLFVQSCAEQSPASRAKCSWGSLGEGDEVLSIDGVPVTHMTRLDCVRRLKESQLVIKLVVRCRGALRPEVVSAERKSHEKSKTPPELPPVPPPVPPRKLRQLRGSADGEANPSPAKKPWEDGSKSGSSSLTDSPQSQASVRSCLSSQSSKSTCYESCNSSPQSRGSSKYESPKGSPKDRANDLCNSKQEPPEPMVYLDARSQDASSTHGSTSDDTGSSFSTVVDRFSTSDRFSTISTISTASNTSEQQNGFDGGRCDNGDLYDGFKEPHDSSEPLTSFERLDSEFEDGQPDYLLARFANSESVAFAESRDHVEKLTVVEKVTSVVAPSTVLIEETITLQPPLSFQDAPLSYGHEAKPGGAFYAADLAADSQTHFRPIKDDAAIVESINGEKPFDKTEETPPLPVRNHVNRIPVNQQAISDASLREDFDDKSKSESPSLPPKPMPRKDVKMRKKRPPPPPPPTTTPRRDVPPVPTVLVKIADDETRPSAIAKPEMQAAEDDERAREAEQPKAEQKTQIEALEKPEGDLPMNKVLEIIEMKKVKAFIDSSPQRTTLELPENPPKILKDDSESSERKAESSKMGNFNSEKKEKNLQWLKNQETTSTDLEASEDDLSGEEEKVDSSNWERLEENGIEWQSGLEGRTDFGSEVVEGKKSGKKVEECSSDVEGVDGKTAGTKNMSEGEKNDVAGEPDSADESDDCDYYWQSSLATIGEEEETNSLEDINKDEEDFELSLGPSVKESQYSFESSKELQHQKVQDDTDCVRRIARDPEAEDKKPDKNVVNGRMDNCGGGQRLPPDGDEFPASYQEFKTSSQYQFVTSRSTAVKAGDRLTCDEEKPLLCPEGAKTPCEERPESLNQTQKTPDTGRLERQCTVDPKPSNAETSKSYPAHLKKSNVEVMITKKIEISDCYPKGVQSEVADSFAKDFGEGSPPPLPLSRPPMIDHSLDNHQSQARKYSLNGDSRRQDDKSERSVRDKIAMFSSQGSLEVPLFPLSNTRERMSKHKSSEDVFIEEKRTNSYDLANQQNQASKRNHRSPSLPSTFLPDVSEPTTYPSKVSTSNSENKRVTSSASSPLCSGPGSYVSNGSWSPQQGIAEPDSKNQATLFRATSFSAGSTIANEKPHTSATVVDNPSISRTNSLASTFSRRNNETARRNSLNQLIEQRRKSISKLRGLVIPEKETVPVDQPIIDLPEIKSRDSILNQVPKPNIQDKWGSQNSLVSNASATSSSTKTTVTSFKMAAPQIMSKYSPAFKRKSLTVYNNATTVNSSTNESSSPKNSQLTTIANRLVPDAPKSLESICSPTRSDYSFDFVSTSGSPDTSRSRPRINQKKNRADYDDSDNDSAVSSSQSSISRGFSPPMSPAPSERSTVSSERSYMSMEMNYHRRSTPSTDTPVRNQDSVITDKTPSRAERYNLEKSSSNLRSSSFLSNDGNKNTHVTRRQDLKRSNSTDTSCSNSSTLTSGSQASAESLSRRVLKPQSVEAINRKNILASARCRSGKEMNGSPLIQRKFSDDGDLPVSSLVYENGEYFESHQVVNGSMETLKKDVKVAYIEVVDNFSQNDKPNLREQSSLERSPSFQSEVTPSKPQIVEASNDLKMWVRAEAKSLSGNSEEKATGSKESVKDLIDVQSQTKTLRKTSSILEVQTVSPVHSKCQNILGDSVSQVEAKVKTASGVVPSKSLEDQNDLLTVLATKSRSRSAIHVDESNYGRSKSQMSLEDILTAKVEPKLQRAQSVTLDGKLETNHTLPLLQNSRMYDSKNNRFTRKSDYSSSSSWAESKATFISKIPASNRPRLVTDGLESNFEAGEKSKSPSKIPTSRSLGRRSASVTDMKKALEKPEMSLFSGASSPGSQLHPGNHNRFPSLDSSVEENMRPVGTDDRYCGEQFGSISSLASSTSLISQQELAQLVEEASLEEARGAHDIIVVLLHKENPNGSVGITLAGGVDCEAKEITVHRVLTHSIADKDGRVQRGDRILSINGRSTRGLTHHESLAVLKQPRPEVVLVVSRARYEDGCRLRSRTDSVETIIEGLETNGGVESTAWGPPATVAVYKDGAGLGFSLEGGRDSPLGDRPLIIKKIFTGGAAEKTGALKAGDQLLEVNGNDVTRMSRIEAWSLMKKLHDGEVNLLVRHPATKSS